MIKVLKIRLVEIHIQILMEHDHNAEKHTDMLRYGCIAECKQCGIVLAGAALRWAALGCPGWLTSWEFCYGSAQIDQSTYSYVRIQLLAGLLVVKNGIRFRCFNGFCWQLYFICTLLRLHYIYFRQIGINERRYVIFAFHKLSLGGRRVAALLEHQRTVNN